MKTTNLIAGLVLVVSLVALMLPVQVCAMFARYSDVELLNGSNLIVEAEYLGSTDIQLGPAGSLSALGVLKVRNVLKGSVRDGVILLAVPSAKGPVSSSDIVYRPGQTGLWFLRERGEGSKGVFLADHPQRFIAATDGQARIDAFKRLLGGKK